MTLSRTLLPLLMLVVGQLAACAQSTLPTPPRPPAPASAPAPLPTDGSQGTFGAPAKPAASAPSR